MTEKPKSKKPYQVLQARLGDELFTPVDNELLALLERLRNEYGSWQAVGEGARVSQRWLRYLRSGRFKCVGYSVLDRMLTNLGWVGEVQKLEWYKMEELLEKGLWNEQITWGPHTGVETRFGGVRGNKSGPRKGKKRGKRG